MMIKQSTYVVPASFWQKLDGIIFIILVFDLHQFPLSSSQIEDADIFDAISYRFDFKLGFFLASNPYAPVILASIKDNFISPVIVPKNSCVINSIFDDLIRFQVIFAEP